MRFGRTFGDELISAGLGSLPFGWRDDGTLVGVENLTDDQSATLNAVIAAHDPNKKPIVSFTPLAIIKTMRTIDEAGARAFFANMDELDKAEFFAADKIPENDPSLVAALGAISTNVDQLKADIPADSIAILLSVLTPHIPIDVKINGDP